MSNICCHDMGTCTRRAATSLNRKGLQTVSDYIAQFSRGELSGLTALLLIVCFIEWIIGQAVNINLCVLLTYGLYLWVLYIRDKRLILEQFWLFTMSTLNLLGVFYCDEGIYLRELQLSSYYICALSPLVVLYIILFFSIEFYRIGKEGDRHEDKQWTKWNWTKYKIALLFATLLGVYLLSTVIGNPYYAAGTLRLEYAAEHMSSLSVSLRTYLPFFIPISAAAWNRGCKLLPAVFALVTLVFYFLEGDKFGAYFFAAYISVLAILPSLSDRAISSIIKLLFILLCLLIGIVYIQRVLLFNNTLVEFIGVLSDRLSAQGEVWWSVFDQIGLEPYVNADYTSEINAIVHPSSQIYGNYGQWKMMRVAARYSANSAARVAVGNPYAATTAASLLYYFGYPITFLFYFIIGFIYASIIRNASIAFYSKRLMESMVYVKLISIFGNIMFASNITYPLSIAGISYFITLMCLVLYRELNDNRPKLLSTQS